MVTHGFVGNGVPWWGYNNGIREGHTNAPIWCMCLSENAGEDLEKVVVYHNVFHLKMLNQEFFFGEAHVQTQFHPKCTCPKQHIGHSWPDLATPLGLVGPWARTPCSTSWTMCGPTFSRTRLTWSWPPGWKDEDWVNQSRVTLSSYCTNQAWNSWD